MVSREGTFGINIVQPNNGDMHICHAHTRHLDNPHWSEPSNNTSRDHSVEDSQLVEPLIQFSPGSADLSSESFWGMEMLRQREKGQQLRPMSGSQVYTAQKQTSNHHWLGCTSNNNTESQQPLTQAPQLKFSPGSADLSSESFWGMEMLRQREKGQQLRPMSGSQVYTARKQTSNHHWLGCTSNNSTDSQRPLTQAPWLKFSPGSADLSSKSFWGMDMLRQREKEGLHAPLDNSCSDTSNHLLPPVSNGITNPSHLRRQRTYSDGKDAKTHIMMKRKHSMDSTCSGSSSLYHQQPDTLGPLHTPAPRPTSTSSSVSILRQRAHSDGMDKIHLLRRRQQSLPMTDTGGSSGPTFGSVPAVVPAPLPWQPCRTAKPTLTGLYGVPNSHSKKKRSLQLPPMRKSSSEEL